MSLKAFRTTPRQVLALSRKDKLVDAIKEGAGKCGTLWEHRSWQASLPELAKVLKRANLFDIDMLVECSVPGTTKRVDVILAGTDPSTGTDSYVLVELKQWTDAQLGWDSKSIVWTLYTKGDQPHPVHQVRGYCRYLQRDLVVLHENSDTLHGIAFLHKAKKKNVLPLLLLPQDQLGNLFTGDESAQFIEYLQKRIAPDDDSAGTRLLMSELRPRKNLLDSTAEEIIANEDALLDNQRLAVEAVLNRIEHLRESNLKCAVLVTGGPGSGKTLVALTLLKALRKKNINVQYATGSSSITRTMRRIYRRQDRDLEKRITYYRSLSGLTDWLDVAICDEAHRLRRYSTDRYTPRDEYDVKKAQIDEIFNAARVSVFLLDENQVVRPEEVGTIDHIREHAARAGMPVFQIDLDGQFRCGGSAVYDEWVLNLLGLRALGPMQWKDDGRFIVRSARSPQQMEDFLRAKITSTVTARMTAGYCWDWTPEPDINGKLVRDIQIGDWSKPWNNASDNVGKSDDPPPSWLWAYDPRGFEQIGCIYTAQGFEFDWAGVIFGPEITVENQRLIVKRDANKDKALRSKNLFDEDFDTLIRNTYKVLLTRGMQGVVIYAVDPATQALISNLVEPLP
ncbi:DNA/RNA helicase domain-containing protein [Nocardia brasiliensis]